MVIAAISPMSLVPSLASPLSGAGRSLREPEPEGQGHDLVAGLIAEMSG